MYYIHSLIIVYRYLIAEIAIEPCLSLISLLLVTALRNLDNTFRCFKGKYRQVHITFTYLISA